MFLSNVRSVKHKHLLLSITNSLILFELGGELEKASRVEQVFSKYEPEKLSCILNSNLGILAASD